MCVPFGEHEAKEPVREGARRDGEMGDQKGQRQARETVDGEQDEGCGQVNTAGREIIRDCTQSHPGSSCGMKSCVL